MSRANPRFRRSNIKLPTPVNNVYRVRVLGKIENQLTVSSFFYRDARVSQTATTAFLTDLGTGFIAPGGMLAKYAAACSSDWSVSAIIIDCANLTTLSPLFAAQTGNGGGPATHMPTEVSMPLIRRTAVKGQCGRGRISTPAVPLSWVTASVLSNTAAHTALATQMLSTITQGGEDYTPCLYSRNGSKFAPGQGVADLISVDLPAGVLVGTTRRRKLNRGR